MQTICIDKYDNQNKEAQMSLQKHCIKSSAVDVADCTERSYKRLISGRNRRRTHTHRHAAVKR